MQIFLICFLFTLYKNGKIYNLKKLADTLEPAGLR